MHRMRFGIGLAALLAVALLIGTVAGCAKPDPNKNHLIIVVGGELDGTDVQQVFTSNIVQQLTTPAPVVFDLQQRNLVPQVAKGITFSEDGKSIILEFPADLKFAGGRAATGEDIKASIERYIEISPYAEDWAELDDIEVDGHKVTLNFVNPPAYFLTVLASTYSGIIDAQEAERVGDEAFNRKVVGIGPFTLTEWSQGSHFSFERNPNYKDNKPFVQNHGPSHFEKVTVRVIPDALTRLSELTSGKVDVVYDISPEHRNQIQNNANVELLSYAAAGQVYLRFNNSKATFADKRFREAINYAINKDLLKQAMANSVEPVYGLLSPSQLAYSQETDDAIKAERKHDQQRAKDLLAELGYTAGSSGMLEKDGRPLKLLLISSNTAQSHQMAAPVIQDQLKAVGIDVEIQEHGRQYVRELVNTGGYDLAIQQWSWTDPDIWYYSFHSSNANPIWSTPELDGILDTGRSMMDMAERTAKYGELSTAVADHLPMVPLFYSINYIGVRKAVTGLHFSVDGTLFYEDAKK